MHSIPFDFDFSRWPSALLSLIPCLLNLGIAAYILLFMPRTRLSRIFALFTVVLALWQFEDTMMRLSRTAETAIFWDHILSASWIFTAPICIHLTLIYTRRLIYLKPVPATLMFYLPAFIYHGLHNYYLQPSFFHFSSFLGWIDDHNVVLPDRIGLGWITLVILSTIPALIRDIIVTKNDKERRAQTIMILTGFSIPAIQGIITQVVFPLVLKIDALPLTSTFMLFYSVMLLVALNRHQLFNLAEVVSTEKVVNTMRDIIFTVSPFNQLTYINPHGAELLGFQAAKLPSRDLRDMFLQGSDPSVWNNFQQLVLEPVWRGQSVDNFSIEMVSAKGTAVPVLLSASPLINNRSNQGILFAGHDMTVVRKAEREKEHTEKRFRVLIEKSRDGLVIADREGIITYCSPSITAILGFEAGELTGTQVADKISARFRNSFDTSFNTIIQLEDARVSASLLCYHKNGKEVWVEGTAQNMLNEAGVNAIVISFRDITERKEAEEALKRKNEELQKINTELDHFVYSASHHIKAPLATILGIVNLAEEETRDEQQKMLMGMVKQSINKLDGFTRDIIHYYGNTHSELKLEAVCFREVLAEAMAEVKKLKEAEGVRFDLELNHPTGNLQTDRKRLSNVLYSLLANAVQHRDIEGRDHHVAISFERSAEYTNIRVRDNGEGIPTEQQSKVFDMFYQASNRSSGAGLGLYIVKEMVERLDGGIYLESEPGAGTTFHIRLPQGIS